MEIIALVLGGGAFSIVILVLEQKNKLEKRVEELERELELLKEKSNR